MKHETEDDRIAQQEVADFLHRTLTSRFEFVGHYTNWVARPNTGLEEDHDFDVWFAHLKVGIVEVKCRTYPKDFFENKGYMIDRDKLMYLYRQNKYGFKAMLAIRTGDNFVYHAMIEDLIAEKETWEVATPEMMSTTNHGKGKRDEPKEGFVLPMKLFKAGGWIK